MKSVYNQIYIILPCYNEGFIIRQTVTSLLEFDYNVVVIDDASTDNTCKQLSGLPLYYLRHPVNLGQGAAIQTGIDFALKKGAVYIVTFDADNQHDAKDIAGMMGVLINGKTDIVFGSRFLPGGSSDSSEFRKFLLHIARYINYFFSGILLSDAHNGFRALNSRAAGLIRLKENRMTHASEFLLQVKRNALKFTEHPVHIKYTEYSKKKGQSLLNSIRIFFDLVLNKIYE